MESGEPSESPLTRCVPKLQSVREPPNLVESDDEEEPTPFRGAPPEGYGHRMEWEKTGSRKPVTYVQFSKKQIQKLKTGKQIMKPIIKISKQDGAGNILQFVEKRAASLRPLQAPNGEWEYFEAILDSGASVTVVPSTLGKDYEVQPGEASRAGVTYEIADGTEIPNLGEKLMPIMTADGTTRGMRAQVADVSKPLQAVRSLIRTGHVVVFGGGDNGDEHFVINRLTGEVNEVKDDGVNYLMGMYVIPKAAMAMDFARPAPAK